MAKITPESIANLKSLFQDNEKALGSNFSQLIDFFNDKVTNNGDVIPTINLDEFQQDFDQLKTDLTNQVSTLQGPKGNTGNGISSTTIQYQISNNATTAPTGTWSNSLIATTQVNPFLWTQVTLNYDDGTSKSFYLVSSKGDKGDKGDTGDIGPIGPVGPVGAGLVVKGTVNNASQLPTTGNQEGYCYFVGTDLYVWDAGTWKNCGSVSPDLSKYVTVTDLNNGLNAKVTDNKDGTEQLNGVQVQPFNKLSDTIGGRNLITNSDFSSGLDHWEVNEGTNADCKAVVTTDSDGDTCVHITGTGAYCGLYFRPVSFNQNQVTTGSTLVKGTGKCNLVGLNNRPGSNFGTISTESYSKVGTTVKADSGTSTFCAYFDPVNGVVDVYIKLVKLEQGSIATDWTPAPEDKVNVSDMRKPASDVAGIEEVNAKQDKIGYTPANNSNVVHTTGTEEIAGQKTFDTAPIDKATGNPYITKSGVPSVPSTLADTTKDTNFTGKLQKSGIDVATKSDITTAVSTATANMVDSSKPTNFTAGLQVKGVDVATVATNDDTGWQPLVSKNNASASFDDNSYYRIINNILYVHGTISVKSTSYLHYQLWDMPTGWSISDKAGTQAVYPDSTADNNNYVQLNANGLMVYEDKTGYSTEFRFVTPVDKV